MVARRGALVVAAAMGVSLQGCTEMINKHVTGFIETQCEIATGESTASIEEKLLNNLEAECKTIKGVEGDTEDLIQKCLDDGAETIKEEIKKASDEAIDKCVEKFKNAGNPASLLDSAKDFISGSWGNLTDKIGKQLNETVQHVRDEAKDALDSVKDGVQDGIDTVKDGVQDGVDSVKDGVQDGIDTVNGHIDDAQEHLNGVVGERKFSMVRLPGTNAGSSTVACLSGAALLAAAGLVVVVRRASRQAVAEQSTPILACDEEL